MAETVSGPVWEGRNWSSSAGEGSIHDDSTAEGLGFRGGTVAGSVHMNQFPPVLLQVFGDEWFERGNLSLVFKNATVDREPVQVFAARPSFGSHQVDVRMERTDGLLIASGTAAVGDGSQSELQRRDLRACDPSELLILRSVDPGMSLGRYEVVIPEDRQFELFDSGLISDPLDWYRHGSPWGGPIACPSTLVQQLWGIPMSGLRPFVGSSVGLFGAIEVGHVNGPIFVGGAYTLESQVVCVGQSPRTEYLWFDTVARGAGGRTAATLRMQLRFMKASSPDYE
ncbi:MAG: hypothetical protein ACE5EF_02740 [Dehalococcoidia bacterium]